MPCPIRVVRYTRDVDTITAIDVSVFRAPNCDYEYNTGDPATKRIGDVDVRGSLA